MKLSLLYNQAIQFGKLFDPRKNKKRIKNYPDSLILYGNEDSEVRKILIGIDIEAAEVLLAEKIREKKGLDLIISHHPEGKALASLSEVMRLQIDILIKVAGFSPEEASELLEERIREVQRRILPHNHNRSVDVARLLDIAFMCLHTPADNQVYSFLKDLFQKEKPKKIADIIDILMSIAEYKIAEDYNAGPRIILGNPNRSVGKIFLEMTGGTEGSKEIYDNFYKKGIRTIVCMHLSEEHFKKVKDNNLNVIIAGHISSDTLGLNLLLDRIEKATGEKLEVFECSGFRRIRHNI